MPRYVCGLHARHSEPLLELHSPLQARRSRGGERSRGLERSTLLVQANGAVMSACAGLDAITEHTCLQHIDGSHL